MDDVMKDFLQHHMINVVDDNKRAHRHTRLNVNAVKYFTDPLDYNKLTAVDSYRMETERLYTVEIAESELERIAKFEAEVFNNMREHGHYNIFETLMGLKEEELNMRIKYPAVRKAYEHYSLILKMAQSGEL